ncbi:DUF6801 domain-containing protein [Amycolatopsis sp. 195334CR]|uniref:DUF6801 domain-containing protein n=1 Tax=Amycolatopsis sp. 195334CR TaxID=2814588 RepID=UPI001A8D5404|nr:DUF6801 domain-containing protein [Amycolatopsis sp. 195334CR]MBN6040198.1 hypothetical protein [Amycolatopsis sp. 195334CR]
MAASLVATSAEAAPATQQFHSSDLQLTCDFPALGAQYVDAAVSFEGPASVSSGDTVQFSALVAHLVIPRDVVQVYQGLVAGFRATGTPTIDVQGGFPSPISVTVASPYRPLPMPPDDLVLTAYQDPGTTIPAVTAGMPGQTMAASLDAFAVTLDVDFGLDLTLQGPCVLNANQYTWFYPSLPIGF